MHVISSKILISIIIMDTNKLAYVTDSRTTSVQTEDFVM